MRMTYDLCPSQRLLMMTPKRGALRHNRLPRHHVAHYVGHVRGTAACPLASVMRGEVIRVCTALKKACPCIVHSREPLSYLH